MEGMDIIKIDNLTGFALATKDGKYYIIEFHAFSQTNREEVERAFDGFCFNHYIDEQDRLGTALFG